jgi:hypothetical protein
VLCTGRRYVESIEESDSHFSREYARYKGKTLKQNNHCIMSSPHKKFKKSNDEEEHRNKTANEKWVEGYNYFLSQEGKDEHQRRNKEWQASVRKHREETGDNIDSPVSDIVSPFQTHPNSLMNKSFRRYLAQSNTATQKKDNKLSWESKHRDEDQEEDRKKSADEKSTEGDEEPVPRIVNL